MIPDRVGPDKTQIAIGLLTVGLGAMPLLVTIGVLPVASPSYDAAPNWIGWLIGLMFMGAGVLVIIRALAGGNATDSSLPATTPGFLRCVTNLLGTAIICALGVVLTWVAFGPGPRHFSTTFGIPGLSIWEGMGSEWIGRTAFGFCALLFWALFAIWLVVVIWRRSR